MLRPIPYFYSGTLIFFASLYCEKYSLYEKVYTLSVSNLSRNL